MSIYSIYRAVNLLNGKVYIGMDKSWPTRKYLHKSLAKRNLGYKFHSAIRKYGWESFDWAILLQTKDPEYVKDMEKLVIAEYDSFTSGYNQTLGGDGSFGKKQSLENKNAQSDRRREYNKNSRWYNNGKENTFSVECPPGYTLGRINQKPTTLGNRWYNNGVQQRLTKYPPDGWVQGMLS